MPREAEIRRSVHHPRDAEEDLPYLWFKTGVFTKSFRNTEGETKVFLLLS